MKHRVSTKLLSLFLVIALLVSCCPFAFAAEVDGEPADIAEAETTESIVETEATEAVTEPAEETEVTEAATEPAEETEATEAATEPAEETEATDATEAALLLEDSKTVADGALPFGLKGLPEGYVLSEQELAKKQDMIDHEVAKATAEMTAGVDYEEGVLLISADSEETIQLYAEAFGAEVLVSRNGLAKIRLSTATVAEAVEAAQNMNLPLPAAYPNQLVRVEPIVSAPTGTVSAMGDAAPQRRDWNYWIENMDFPDPALMYANGYYDSEKDEYYRYQYMHDTVDTYAAWGVTTGAGVKVAVLDSGVDGNHPDLKDHVVASMSELPDVDPVGTHRHGTHVAGIIAATMNNGLGGAGIAPDARIINIRVLDEEGGGDAFGITQGIKDAVTAGAKVINMSLGGWGYSADMQEAINDAVSSGVTVVAAMGNEGINRKDYPAAYDNVIAVVATDPNNTRAVYSSYGPWADVAAPGSGIYSTVPGNSYDSWNGTSMATPVVSGVVALYKSIHPEATPAQIEERLKATATRGGSDLGAGIVNAAKMLSDKPAAPAYTVTDASGNAITPVESKGKLTVPCESRLKFNPVADDSEFILYTLNGSSPAVKNGVVVNGEVYDWDDAPIDLTAYAGKTITLKAVQVNGLGMMGTMLSKKIVVKNTDLVTGFTVSGPQTVIAGGSVQFTALVEPADKASQAVTWSIVYYSPNMKAARIDSKGKLTVPRLAAGQSGTVEVRAESKTYPDLNKTLSVTVEPLTPVARMVVNPTKITLPIGGEARGEASLAYAAYDARKNVLNPVVSWVSSNPKVAVVDSNGVVKAKAKGTVTITCKAQDGSGKSAKCTVTVAQLVQSIEITGQSSIAPGATAAYKVTALPASANNKAVIWSLENAPEGVTVSTRGVVKVSANAPAHGTFILKATAADGSEVVGQREIRIVPKCTSVYVWYDTIPGRAPGPNAWDNERQKFTAVGLFNVDLQDTEPTENQITLIASPYKDGSSVGNDDCVVFSSSNPAVASVDSNGTVTAHKAGTARITAAAMDGSGKKATVSVKVTVPVSTISLVSSAPKGSGGLRLLAAGKSVSHKVVFGKTYGTPSNQKVYWGYYVGYKVEGEDSYEWIDLTEEFKQAKAVSFSGGRLTIKSSASALIRKYKDSGKQLFAKVYAEAADGTWASAGETYRLVEKPATYLYAVNEYDQPQKNFVADYVDANVDGAYYLPLKCDQFTRSFIKDGEICYESDFTVNNSNPKAINVVEVESRGDGEHWLWFTTDAKGTARVTIKTTDGSNKSCTVTITVT